MSSFKLDKAAFGSEVMKSDWMEAFIRSEALKSWSAEDQISTFKATSRAMAINWTNRNLDNGSE